jgi:lipoprotein signal peptidase
LLRGAVIDFVRLDGWPTFNVADSAITIGAILLVVRALFGGREERIRPEST